MMQLQWIFCSLLIENCKKNKIFFLNSSFILKVIFGFFSVLKKGIFFLFYSFLMYIDF